MGPRAKRVHEGPVTHHIGTRTHLSALRDAQVRVGTRQYPTHTARAYTHNRQEELGTSNETRKTEDDARYIVS